MHDTPFVYGNLLVGLDQFGTLVQIQLEQPGSAIKLTPETADDLAELLLHYSRLARQKKRIIQSN